MRTAVEAPRSPALPSSQRLGTACPQTPATPPSRPPGEERHPHTLAQPALQRPPHVQLRPPATARVPDSWTADAARPKPPMSRLQPSCCQDHRRWLPRLCQNRRRWLPRRRQPQRRFRRRHWCTTLPSSCPHSPPTARLCRGEAPPAPLSTQGPYSRCQAARAAHAMASCCRRSAYCLFRAGMPAWSGCPCTPLAACAAAAHPPLQMPPGVPQ
mmetsp:Transcript_29975/g.88915  ORF Transcript_29975/g.88915 Transcript_29975/m.88915 type:complete len:213 (+) Transcript_29975:3762-4400(+)